MSVRIKILIVIGLTFVALLGIFYFTFQWFLLQNIIAVEETSAAQDASRLRASLGEQIIQMGANVGDWAPWDDTYEFINNGNTIYVDSKISDATFTNLGVEFMLFIDNSGKIVFGKMLNIEGAETPIPQSLYDEVKAGSLLLNHKSPADKIAGILSLPEGAVIIASQPIVTSQGEGPIRGTLVMGRFLGSAEISKLAKRTQLSISAFPYQGAVLPDDVARAQSFLAGANPIFVAPQNETIISGYTLLNDIYGKPALILRIDAPREAFAQAKTSMNYLGLALLAIGVFSALVTMLLLEKLVITRLTGLTSSVMNVGNETNIASRVKVSGNDEIFTLATSVNSMLTSLENARTKQREIYDQVVAEQKVSERLLLNVLPHSIAERLKGRPEVLIDNFTEIIADRFEEVTVLFADIVEFSKFSESVSAEVVVDVLNDIFSRFDVIAESRGLEKIKTIGDSYMAAAGLPIPMADHGICAAHMALDMLEAIECFNAHSNLHLKIRIGIDSGAVVAGVIGKRKFLYDLWGNVVNTASRMQSHGVAGRIQVTESTRRRLSESFMLEKRGVVEIKGMGEIDTWFLNSRCD